MKIKYKSSISLKNFSIDETGEFTCYGNIFNVVDEAQEVTLPGCFTESIEHYKELGTMPIFLFDHDQYNVMGKWIEIEEDETGLLLKGKFNLENPEAQLKYIQLKNKDIQSFSIGYTCDEGDYEVRDGACYLKKVTLYEVSLVVFACNDRSLLIDIKNNSSKTEPVQEVSLVDETPSVPPQKKSNSLSLAFAKMILSKTDK
ncbi:Caudovirus prohead protease [compost metagenome]